ncbi:MAG: methylmalonyl-CoA mutase family protein, partial [bacterium]
RTQQVIAYESGVTNFVDPLGGSEVVEKLTSELEEEALAIIEEIDNMGGAISTIETGWIQSEIAKSAYEYQKSIDSINRKIVGVNSFEEDNPSEANLQGINQTSVKNQIDGVLALKENRDNGSVQTKLSTLQSAAKLNDNLMPTIIDCIRAECTLGEVADTFRSQFGEFNQT